MQKHPHVQKFLHEKVFKLGHSNGLSLHCKQGRNYIMKYTYFQLLLSFKVTNQKPGTKNHILDLAFIYMP